MGFLQDEITQMKRMYEDLFYNLDYGNFSKNLNDDMNKFKRTFKEIFPDGTENESIIEQTANKILLYVGETYETKTDAGIEYTKLQASITLTAENITSMVAATYETKDGVTQKISVVQQTADKISWLVSDTESGTSSTFTLTSRAATLITNQIQLYGCVTFGSLTTPGQTTIHGSNIITGTIDAHRVNFKDQNGAIYIGNSWASPEAMIIRSNSSLTIATNGHIEICHTLTYGAAIYTYFTPNVNPEYWEYPHVTVTGIKSNFGRVQITDFGVQDANHFNVWRKYSRINIGGREDTEFPADVVVVGIDGHRVVISGNEVMIMAPTIRLLGQIVTTV